MSIARAIGQAAAQAAVAAAKGATEVAYGQTTQGKVAQGASELANALFSGANAYSPASAEMANRAKYQTQDQSQGLSR